METKMTEVERHRFKMLQKVYETWIPPTPVLKNRDIDIPNGMVPYISSSDVHDYKYNVRIISYDALLWACLDHMKKLLVLIRQGGEIK